MNLFLSRMKIFAIAHNAINIESGGSSAMSKKKNHKVKTLTDEQYNQYLMALKDERPTMLVDKDGNLTPQK